MTISKRCLVLIIGLLFCGSFGHVLGQEVDSPAEKPAPVTTSDPEIPKENLEVLVKPLTKEELVVEADGWRDLLKANAQAIAEVRIGIKEQQSTEQEDSEQVETSDPPGAPAEDQGTQDESVQSEESRQDLAETLAELQLEKDELISRVNIVIDELERKGGDVVSYRQYVSALTGIAVEISDAATAWTVLQGWIKSETGGQRWAWNIAKFVAIFLAFYFSAAILASIVRHAASRVKGASQLMVNFLGRFVKQAVIVIGIVVALSALEVNITPLLAAIGAAGFVIGFALQDTLSNFASGLLILAYRPFDVGDVVEAADVSGKVESVSLFSTHIVTFDNKMMIVPNNDIWGSTITNASAKDTRRVDLVFGIGYDDNIERAADVLRSVVEQHDLVLADPAPVIEVNELADSSINFICRPWTKTSDYWTVYWDLTKSVKEQFDRHGISIPYPQRDIHVHQTNSPVKAPHSIGRTISTEKA